MFKVNDKSTRNTIEFGFLSVEDISLTLAAHVSQTKTDITLLTHASCVCHQCFYLRLFSFSTGGSFAFVISAFIRDFCLIALGLSLHLC